jgi:hypothetical protein
LLLLLWLLPLRLLRSGCWFYSICHLLLCWRLGRRGCCLQRSLLSLLLLVNWLLCCTLLATEQLPLLPLALLRLLPLLSILLDCCLPHGCLWLHLGCWYS